MRSVIVLLALTFLVGVVAGRMEEFGGEQLGGGTPVGRAIGGKPLVQDRYCKGFWAECSPNLAYHCCSGNCDHTGTGYRCNH